MSRDLIYVTPLSAVAATVATRKVSHVVTLINDETLVRTPAGIEPGNHLRLAMNDICEARPGQVIPCADHVAELIAFTLAWDRKAPMLIHCWAGISRSTAAAFIALCSLNPKADERAAARAIRAGSPTAFPNRLLVALGDEALGRGGRMIEAVEEIGRGHTALEGTVFALPLRPRGGMRTR